MAVRHATYAERQRQIEAGARKRREAKQDTRRLRACALMDQYAEARHDAGFTHASVTWSHRTGKYTVHEGVCSHTLCEKQLTERIALMYARQHEVELTDNIPEDDK